MAGTNLLHTLLQAGCVCSHPGFLWGSDLRYATPHVLLSADVFSRHPRMARSGDDFSMN